MENKPPVGGMIVLAFILLFVCPKAVVIIFLGWMILGMLGFPNWMSPTKKEVEDD